MGAPSLWVQILIAFFAIAALPFIIALLIKLRVFPLVAFLLVVDSFEEWALANESMCKWILIACIAYPILAWGFKIFRWWREEQQCRQAMLASAIPWYELALEQDQ